MDMRKTIVIVFAVAVLGGLTFYVNQKNESTPAQVTAQPSASEVRTQSMAAGTYKDGKFSGSAAETPYGPVQISIVISNGKISDVKFIDMPDDENRSREITSMSAPLLKETTLAKQNADDLDMVSGATSTYYGYQESLQAALDEAKAS